RRGYFVAGLGATQFATAGALDLLRSFRDAPEKPETFMLAATDPANPYGAIVKWPESMFALTRSVGASVIIVDGKLAASVGRGEKASTDSRRCCRSPTGMRFRDGRSSAFARSGSISSSS